MSTRGPRAVKWRTAVGSLWLFGVAVLAVGGLIPIWPVVIYVAASGAAFLTYAVDKARAGAGGRRVPEKVLQVLALAGGWPGALIAQERYRHKTRKVRFQVIFWLIVAAHIAAAAAWWYVQSGSTMRGR